MSYVTDVVRMLPRIGVRLDEEKSAEIQTRVNSKINPYQPDWFRFFRTLLLTEAGVSAKQLQLLLDTWCAVTETMRHVQIGNPENILIASSSMDGLYGEALARLTPAA